MPRRPLARRQAQLRQSFHRPRRRRPYSGRAGRSWASHAITAVTRRLRQLHALRRDATDSPVIGETSVPGGWRLVRYSAPVVLSAIRRLALRHVHNLRHQYVFCGHPVTVDHVRLASGHRRQKREAHSATRFAIDMLSADPKRRSPAGATCHRPPQPNAAKYGAMKYPGTGVRTRTRDVTNPRGRANRSCTRTVVPGRPCRGLEGTWPPGGNCFS